MQPPQYYRLGAAMTGCTNRRTIPRGRSFPKGKVYVSFGTKFNMPGGNHTR